MCRIRVTKKTLSDMTSADFVPGSPPYRLGLVWPLTKEVVSLSGRYDGEQRLQRHITRLSRRKGLIRNKRAARRTTDIADAEALESLQRRGRSKRGT